MASNNLSPRQKMINLMYLIFIAMLALNISKEILQAFGLMNQRLEENNVSATDRNTNFLASLNEKAVEQPMKFEPLRDKANQINTLADEFVNYLDELKTGSTAKLERLENGQLPAEEMDKSDYLDQRLFIGEKLKEDGQLFLDKMNSFRDGVVSILGGESRFEGVISEVNKKFNTDDVTDAEGVTKDYMHYNYFGFPLISSVTKMTGLQNDVKTTQSEVLSVMLQDVLIRDISLNNYEAIVIPEKTAFFSGEPFKGKVVLGRFDNTLRFDKIVVNGNELDASALDEGQVNLDFPAGNVGTKEINGHLYFTEDGVLDSIPINTSYAVISRPNSATISADKMNVVYRGVVNPMTISFAGVADNNVTATAAGLTRTSGSSFEMRPGTGREVTINVSGKLPDGSPVSDSQTFRIKDIPRPTGTIRGEDGLTKMQRQALEISSVGAVLQDFDFELPLRVNSFKFKVEGAATVEVQGNKLDSRAKSALRRAKRGSTVQIFDVNAKIVGNTSYRLKKVSPVLIELTN